VDASDELAVVLLDQAEFPDLVGGQVAVAALFPGAEAARGGRTEEAFDLGVHLVGDLFLSKPDFHAFGRVVVALAFPPFVGAVLLVPEGRAAGGVALANAAGDEGADELGIDAGGGEHGVQVVGFGGVERSDDVLGRRTRAGRGGGDRTGGDGRRRGGRRLIGRGGGAKRDGGDQSRIGRDGGGEQEGQGFHGAGSGTGRRGK